MLRIASAAFVLTVLPISAEAGYYGGLRGDAVYGPRGGAVAHGGYAYRGGYYGGYRSAYYGPRYYGGSYRPFVTPRYYVNGCYNGYSDDGVYCHVYVGCPYSGY